jgi:hypothetical protein
LRDTAPAGADFPQEALVPRPAAWRELVRTAIRTVAAGAVVALTVGLLPGAAHADDPEPTTPVAPTFRMMTLNIRHGLSPALWAADAQRATTMSDILNMQEASESSDRTALVAMLKAQGWGWWYPAKGGVEIPIAWNNRLFSLVSTRSIETHGGQKGVTPARFINTVILRENATDRLIAVINTHTLNKGAPEGGRYTNSRTARLRLHIAKLRDEILRAQQTTPYVIATGDLNVNYLRDRNIKAPGLPTSTLGPIVNFDMPLGSTWNAGTSLLDYVMTPKREDGLQAVDAQIVGGFRTDHKGVVVGYVFAGDPTTPATPPGTVTPPSTARPPLLPASSVRFRGSRLVNRPHGTLARKRVVTDYLRKVVDNAPRGSAIHLATANLADSRMRYALLHAYKRGVHVQVVTRNPGLNKIERQLRSVLGTDTGARSWFATCGSAHCKKVAKRMAVTTLLVSQSGQSRAVRVKSTRAVDRSAWRRAHTAWTSTTLPAYNVAFHDYYDLVGYWD